MTRYILAAILALSFSPAFALDTGQALVPVDQKGVVIDNMDFIGWDVGVASATGSYYVAAATYTVVALSSGPGVLFDVVLSTVGCRSYAGTRCFDYPGNQAQTSAQGWALALSTLSATTSITAPSGLGDPARMTKTYLDYARPLHPAIGAYDSGNGVAWSAGIEKLFSYRGLGYPPTPFYRGLVCVHEGACTASIYFKEAKAAGNGLAR